MSATNLSRRSFLKASAALPVAAALPAAASTGVELIWGEAAIAVAAPAAAVAPAWGWWAKNDSGDRFSLGPFATREEAVDEGSRSWGGDAFDIIEAIQAEPDLRVSGDSLIEWLDERNEDVWDPEGDCTVFTSNISKEAKGELGNVVSDAIAAWVERHNLSVNGFSFSSSRNEEVIPEDRPASLALAQEPTP